LNDKVEIFRFIDRPGNRIIVAWQGGSDARPPGLIHWRFE
jgi:hypothetical protein